MSMKVLPDVHNRPLPTLQAAEICTDEKWDTNIFSISGFLLTTNQIEKVMNSMAAFILSINGYRDLEKIV